MTEISLGQALSIILTLVVLEGLLSADNALVMAIMVRPLPKGQQKRALMYGIVGAFVFRFLMLIAAYWIIKLWYLRAAGAAYLAYLTAQHFRHRLGGKKVDFDVKPVGFWKTVLVVNLVDCVFAIDSVLVAVGLSSHLLIVFIGVALGIVAVRIAAGGFIKVLEKWPALEDVAYLLIGWISLKLFVESYGMFVGDPHIEMPKVIMWSGMALIAVGGTLNAIRIAKRKTKPEVKEHDVTKEVI
jgi:YkoY family integral membrane protein